MLLWHFEMVRRGNNSALRAALRTFQWVARCRAASRANECFQRGQRNGTYPLHSAEEFSRWIKQSGFEIVSCESNWYRDPVTSIPLDDLVVARRLAGQEIDVPAVQGAVYKAATQSRSDRLGSRGQGRAVKGGRELHQKWHANQRSGFAR